MVSAERLLLYLLAFFVPPLPVFLAQKTIFTKEFLVSVILTLFGHLPGFLFSIYFLITEAHRADYVRLDEESNVSSAGLPRFRYSPEASQQSAPQGAPQTAPEPAVVPEQAPEPVEGSSEAPPLYDDVVSDQRLAAGQADSKAAGDNKVQL